MAMASLRDLYIEELNDLYDAEQQILVSLPKMIQTANNSELRDALERHRDLTQH